MYPAALAGRSNNKTRAFAMALPSPRASRALSDTAFPYRTMTGAAVRERCVGITRWTPADGEFPGSAGLLASAPRNRVISAVVREPIETVPEYLPDEEPRCNPERWGVRPDHV